MTDEYDSKKDAHDSYYVAIAEMRRRLVEKQSKDFPHYKKVAK